MLARGSTANAKEDTRVFVDAVNVNATTDLSQYATNLTTNGAGGAYEASSTRVSLTSTRTLWVKLTLGAAEASKAILVHGPTSQLNMSFAIGTDGGGRLVLYQNGAVVWLGTVAVKNRTYGINWAMRPNPDTTGAGDARISEVMVYDFNSSAVDVLEQVTHAAPTTNAAWYLTIGGWWDGAAADFAPANTIQECRIDSTFHPAAEVFEDWVDLRPSYAGTLDDVPAEPVGPVTVASTLGDSGYFVGRHNVGYAAAHARAVQRRSWSSLANDVFVDVDTMLATPGPSHWKLSDFGDGVYSLMLPWLRWVSVPTGCTHAWMRVQVKSWVTAGAAVPIGVRGYAFNRPSTIGQIGQQPAPSFEASYRGATLTANHTSTGTGEWIDLGLVRLPVFAANVTGWRDTVHLCLAYAIDPAGASGNDANARLQINVWHARPVYKWTPGGLG